MLKKIIKTISNRNVHSEDMEVYRKYVLSMIFIGVSIFYLVLMGVIAFVQGFTILGATDVGVALLIALFVILMMKSKRFEFYYNIMLGIAGLLFLYLFIIGGVENSAKYWCFSFPVLASLITGYKRSLIYSFVLLLLLILSQIFAYKWQIDFISTQSINVLIRYFAVYSIITIVSCIAESVREITHDKMVKYHADMLDTIKELESTRASLRELTNIDPLTEIYNKRFLSSAIKEMMENGREEYIVSMFFDIDDFKKYNDYYGHVEGDKVLVKVVDIIKQKIKEYNGVFVRFGGEELVYIMKTNNVQCAEEIADKIIDDFNKLKIISAESATGYVTVSIGIASCRASELINWKDIVKKSDDAMYKAKKNGKNTFYVA